MLTGNFYKIKYEDLDGKTLTRWVMPIDNKYSGAVKKAKNGHALWVVLRWQSEAEFVTDCAWMGVNYSFPTPESVQALIDTKGLMSLLRFYIIGRIKTLVRLKLTPAKLATIAKRTATLLKQVDRGIGPYANRNRK